MKRILGLDLGTNSIGWAVINAEQAVREDETTFLKPVGIKSAGSRIIPMSADILGDFDKGNSISQTAERTRLRMARRLRERNLLRRERMLRTLKLMGFLPEHFAMEIDANGKFIDEREPKLAWKRDEEGKGIFLFQDSFNEMLRDFAQHQPQLVAEGRKVPYDWTIYYLRKKALTERITKEELAWILLQFNQKRGYYQLRGEEEEEDYTKQVEYLALKVLRVEATDEKRGDEIWYNVYLENDMVYRRTSRFPLDWEGKVKEFIVTTDLEKDGSPKKDKEGNIKRSFRAPKEDDWTLLKKKTEVDIENSKKTVGCYIYDTLLLKPNQKIIGKLVRTVERKYFKDELIQILQRQQELIPELQDRELYKKCIEELYPKNEGHRSNLAKSDFVNLFVNDILFYQRPLKSKKSLIDNCPYEFHKGKDGTLYPTKCIALSNPLFQEFRLWQFIQNLRIYQRERIITDGQMDLFGSTLAGKLQTDVDVTAEFLKSEEDYVRLFDWLNSRSAIKQDTLLNSFFNIRKERGKDKYPYRWNYVEDKEYPCNETRGAMLSGLEKSGIRPEVLTHEMEMALWHILYSVEDKTEIGKALNTFARKNDLGEDFAGVFCKMKPYKKEYRSYSEKAIRKLLPLMRMGKYWSKENIDEKTLERIDKIITGEYDEAIRNRVREKAINLTDIEHFKGLPVWLACYIVYNRHSEAKEIEKWEKPEDIDRYLKSFKQHSLRNPIVEQVITETLRTVRDIWKQEECIDEIHVELGREMKNPADKRRQMTERIQQNENTNLRIKALLMEFLNPELGIENVRPHSPSQQDILRIYEENALDNLTKEDAEYDFVTKVSKMSQPSKADIIRYKCWLEQKYRSPYTGRMIPLSKLFTPAYEIEHIIPQSRYFDDSFSNKVICEAEVNKLKDRLLGYEFIKEHAGEIVQLSQGETVKILSAEEYEKFVKDYYASNRIKMKKLLMDDIPDGFIERQLNDSRYISKVVKTLLSNIVREKQENGEYEQEAVSKNLISCNGSITDRLKKDWGMNDVWNRIILPRFQRLNELTGTNRFTTLNREGHEIPAMPFELQKGFNKKRIDHRHHAMDAIVIACATRDHVNLLNNEAAHSKHNANRYQLQRKLRRFIKITIDGKEREVAQEFVKPWDTFTTDALQTLQNIIVSFKQNLRVINKTTNSYLHYDEEGKKKYLKQTHGDSWAIRKSMHKDTVYGEVNLRKKKTVSLKEAIAKPGTIVNKDFKEKVKELLAQGHDAKYIKKHVEENKDIWSDINPSKIEVYYYTQDEKKQNGEPKERYFATRKPLDTSFDQKKIRDSITDTGIQKILIAHLEAKGNDPEQAFSPDGIDEMNRNIVALNNGKFHQPIIKVRVYEKADKFCIGQTGNKRKKFVEAADGTNLFFAVYETTDKKRVFATIPLSLSIKCQKDSTHNWIQLLDERLRDKTLIEELQPYQKMEIPTDAHLLFILAPNDLVYVPSDDEYSYSRQPDPERIYKTVSFNKKQCFCIKSNVATPIVNKVEYTTSNKMERAITGEMIKEVCIPIKVDRLGYVMKRTDY
ncbi:MAG: type II CRISPR RNA-guided endonuclease Cas9 [Bacteroidaceae bacterium]|nr:type II CRISPR RNA-guided endonuclease Cas9 [Bacteroidaceae bacterium]